ncbi:D-alanyl-D-alanine carboxypeptidase [Borrelia turicatae]|uniref:D-alanyl-D-alanine carboxypeptidase n=1 Tax=Borrelia turicatae TaxID=142 RepID=A0A172XBJ5_BORTU|nr:D-alanyl-D-alanine carboxypeptidase family protein [Borrelia turicatae]ANF34065.1 D-alanyl-D-alanine carboxypeptidase [Borrelia turicatae]UPA14920.1 D-alanyl-D-alanine carboxypeptidase [Borrelia turicatae]
MKIIPVILNILILSSVFGELFSIDLLEIKKVTEDAKSVVLIDYDTKCILYSKNPGLVFPPASLTKLVTIYTALVEARKKNIDLKTTVPISSAASYYNLPLDSSLMFLEEGHKVNFEELLKGLIISSGNDAAIAIAEFIVGKNLSDFVDLMNINVLNLGLINMSFVDTSGYSSDNKITALEMALFARTYIEEFEFILDIHSLKDFIYPRSENLGNTSSLKMLNFKQKNKNVLIFNYPYADGLKTGYIKTSGLNLVATAKKDDIRLIAVVLGVNKGVDNVGERKRALIAQKLFEYGFGNYTQFSFIGKIKRKDL